MDCPHFIWQETITEKGILGLCFEDKKTKCINNWCRMSVLFIFVFYLVVLEFSWTVLISFRSPMILCFARFLFLRVCGPAVRGSGV